MTLLTFFFLQKIYMNACMVSNLNILRQFALAAWQRVHVTLNFVSRSIFPSDNPDFVKQILPKAASRDSPYLIELLTCFSLYSPASRPKPGNQIYIQLLLLPETSQNILVPPLISLPVAPSPDADAVHHCAVYLWCARFTRDWQHQVSLQTDGEPKGPYLQQLQSTWWSGLVGTVS